MPAPKPPRKLVVYANPYFSLDHNGMPNGAVREDAGRTIRRWIGAKLCAEVLEQRVINGESFVTNQNTWFDFSGEKVEVADTAWHRKAINDGHLIAADAYTAHRGSWPHKKIALVPVADALAEARKVAVANWKAHYGEEPAFVAHEAENGSLAGEAPKPTAPSKAPAKAPAAPSAGV